MSGQPLYRHFHPDALIGWRDGQPVPLQRLVSAARVLARRLPQRGHCVNLCEDRLNFMLGFVAALIAHSTSLLPHNRTPAVLDGLAAAYGDTCFLADSPQACARARSMDISDWSGATTADAAPDIDPGHAAIVVFTSGSTGTPQPHVKTWGSLVHAAHAARESLAIAAGSTLLGVVPPQHMWGLEMTIMLPLQAGCAVDAGCPLLPADIAAALARLPDPRWLVATPAHLRACALSGTRLPQLAGMLCSTAMLGTDLAQAMEQACAAPLFEVYGSTETGALAMRRPARNGSFRTLGGIELDVSSGTPVARGGQLTQPVALGDILDLHDSTEFVLRGRASDLVKIAGKRGSLAALNHELNSIPGVVDGVFLAPDGGRGDARLLAFAVAPGLDAAAILGQLRARVDPVFLPRPLIMVEALPRNAAGKLPRENLLALAAAHGRAAQAEHGSAPQQQVEATHPALPHHFPGNPLVPGVWLLALVEQAARDRYGDGMRISMVSDARFRSVLRPGETFRIGLQRLAADRLAFTIERKNARIADGTLMVANIQ